MMRDGTAFRQKAVALTRWLVLGLPFVLPAYVVRPSIGPLPTTILELYVFVLLASFTVGYGWGGWRRAGISVDRWRWPLLAWTLVSFAAVFWSPNVFTGMGLWRAYVLEPILVFLVLKIVLTKKRDVTILVRNMYLTAIGLCLWGVWQFVMGSGIPSPWNVSISEGRRATGPFPFPNALALFVVPVGALAAARFRTRPELFAALAWLSVLVSVLISKSDGGLVALLAATIIVALTHKWGRVVVAALFLVGALFLSLKPTIRDGVMTELLFKSWSGKVRLTIWKETEDLLRDRPLLGAGFGGYPTVFADYHKATYIEIFQYPHNILFNFWVESGVFGVLAFGWVLFVWLKKMYLSARERHRKRRYALWLVRAAPLIAILVHGLVDVPYFKNDLAMLFWLLVFVTTISFETEDA